MNLIFSRSTWLHLRFAFSLFLLPVFIFAVSQAPYISVFKAGIVFIVWHFLIYPASNGYNSYFDKDEGSIALIKKPPRVKKELYDVALLLDLAGILLAFIVGYQFVIAVIVYGILSKLYSHPYVRLKKYPVISFLTVFIFQGAFIFWTSFAAVSGQDISGLWNRDFILGGLISSCLIGASYPLTQVYQHEEDSKRGDRTLSLLLGVRGSFWFSALLFSAATVMMFLFWNSQEKLLNFWIFLIAAGPVFLLFVIWFYGVWHDEKKASFKNMSRMTFTSGILMLAYFIFIWIIKG